MTPCFALVCSLSDNHVGPTGAKALGKALKTKSALQTLKYAAACLQCYCPQPLTVLVSSSLHRVHSTLVCSLSFNNLDAEAAKHLSEGLQANKGLTLLKYARPPLTCPIWQC